MHPVRLAIDAASGDFGTSVIVQGVLKAHEADPGAFSAILCGDEKSIRQAIEASGSRAVAADDLKIEHCPDTIRPQDKPSLAWKNRSKAPIVRCIALQAAAVVDASLSAGDTGILMPASLFLLGRMHGITRPALAAFMPTTGEYPALVIDVGANLDCRPEHLVTFGLMGKDYVKRYLQIDTPRVAILNIGMEERKGNRIIAEANKILKRKCRNYQGFIEGSRVLSGDAEVIVCDGFVGNVLLKACGSFYTLAESVLGKKDPAILETIRSKMAIFNPERYGAAPILGINGVVFKAHGNSSAGAIAQAVHMTVMAARNKVVHPDSRE